jgi:hypothetical protein
MTCYTMLRLHLPITKRSAPIDACQSIMVIKQLFYLRIYYFAVFTKELGIDYVHANKLEIVDGKLTEIYWRNRKRRKESRILESNC